MEQKELRRIQKHGVTYHGKQYFSVDLAKHMGRVAEIVVDLADHEKLKCFVDGEFVCEAEQQKAIDFVGTFAPPYNPLLKGKVERLLRKGLLMAASPKELAPEV